MKRYVFSISILVACVLHATEEKDKAFLFCLKRVAYKLSPKGTRHVPPLYIENPPEKSPKQEILSSAYQPESPIKKATQFKFTQYYTKKGPA